MAGKWDTVKSDGAYVIEEQKPCSGGFCFRVRGPGISGSGLCHSLHEAGELIRRTRKKQQDHQPEYDSDEETPFRP